MCCAVFSCSYLLSLTRLFFNPRDYSSPGSSVHGDSPRRNTGVGCHAPIQGIFLTQGPNPDPPHRRQILYCLSHQGSPYDPANPTSGHIARENHNSKSYMHLSVYCCTVYINQDMEAAWMSIHRGVDGKMWHIYTMEYYLAVKRGKKLCHLQTLGWIYRQSYRVKCQKDKYCILTYMWNLEKWCR